MVNKDILQRLLERIASSELCTKESLATELGVSPDIIDDMLEQLKALELLSEVESGCSCYCNSCEIKPLCHATHNGRIWMLTETGKKQLLKGLL